MIDIRKKLIGELMIGGNKSTVSKHIDLALDIACNKLTMDVETITSVILDKLCLKYCLVPKRVGRAILRVPQAISPEKSAKRALKFLAHSVKFKLDKNQTALNPFAFKRKRLGVPLVTKLSREIIETISGSSISTKRLSEYKKIAEANRAFVK